MERNPGYDCEEAIDEARTDYAAAIKHSRRALEDAELLLRVAEWGRAASVLPIGNRLRLIFDPGRARTGLDAANHAAAGLIKAGERLRKATADLRAAEAQAADQDAY